MFLFYVRDILPSTLKLPEVIGSAETLSDLHEVAQRGAGTDRLTVTHFSDDKQYLTKHRYNIFMLCIFHYYEGPYLQVIISDPDS